MVVILGMLWILAAVVFGVTQWNVPPLISAAPNTTGGFNFGASFGVPFIKTWGFWVAGILVLLGPFAAIWQALVRGGEVVMNKAFGTTSNRRGVR